MGVFRDFIENAFGSTFKGYVSSPFIHGVKHRRVGLSPNFIPKMLFHYAPFQTGQSSGLILDAIGGWVTRTR